MMKIVISLLIFFLPLHALIVTILKCKYEVNTDIIRFWKEFIVLTLLVWVFILAYKKVGYSLKNLYKKNTLLGATTAFIACSALYIYFPFFELRPASVLGFRYDVFFLFTFIIGLYSGLIGELRFFLKILFFSTFGMLAIFLPWYIFGDISQVSEIFGYSSEVSTYTANQCISFSQNVAGQHRFQATFGGPIRMSVFLTIIGSLFAGYMLDSKILTPKKRLVVVGGISIFLLIGIFFSYSKTSILGAILTFGLFSFLSYKHILRKKITKRMYQIAGGVCILPVILITLIKWELFLHLGSVINRFDNLTKSIEMFFYNPFGYGLGIAGPASQIGNSIESAGDWIIAANTVTTVHKFLPENWYMQILLEQGIVGFVLFVALLILIGVRLFDRIKKHRNYISVGIFTAFCSLCFMALFTHSFEEAATSYVLFFFIGLILASSVTREQSS